MSHITGDVLYYTNKSCVSYEKHMGHGFPHIFIETRLFFRCLVNWKNDTGHTWIKPACTTASSTNYSVFDVHVQSCYTVPNCPEFQHLVFRTHNSTFIKED